MNQGQGYAQAAAFVPERVGSGSRNGPQSLAGKRPRRLRSIQGAAHYGNGQKGKKGPGSSNAKVEYHDRRTAAPIFLQSECMCFAIVGGCCIFTYL